MLRHPFRYIQARLAHRRNQRALARWFNSLPEASREHVARYTSHMRGYDAAKPSRLTFNSMSGWGQDINSLIMGNNRVLRERVRDLVRNFPPFTRAIDAHAAFVVGKGARFQSLANPPGWDEDSITRLRQFIERDFRAWMDRADISGSRHLYELSQMVVRSRMEAGEFFARKLINHNHELALQMIEPDRVEGGLDVAPLNDGNLVWQGVEVNPGTGQAIAYHVRDQIYPGHFNYDLARVPASEMLHSFKWLRPGQLRGITDFAPVIVLADNLDDYQVAELDSAKMAAKWLAMVITQEPGAFSNLAGPGGRGRAGQEKKRIEAMENATIQYMQPGEDIKVFGGSGRPGDSFSRFENFVLRMISITAPTSYEVLSGDYSGINYSTSRASKNDLNMLLYPHIFWLQQHFLNKVFSAWLKVEALKKDYLTGYWLNPAAYEQSLWIPAGQQSIDPLREGKADIDSVAAGFKSPQQVILSQGGDPEKTLREIADWKAAADALGISFNLSGISTQMQSNPDKLGATEQTDLENLGGSY